MISNPKMTPGEPNRKVLDLALHLINKLIILIMLRLQSSIFSEIVITFHVLLSNAATLL